MNLEEIHKLLRKIDYRLIKLLDERMELLLKLTRLQPDKNAMTAVNGFRNVEKYSQGLLQPAFYRRLYRDILTESKKLLDRDFKLIAFQGEHGAYSEVAARVWDDSLIPIPCTEFTEIFEEVEAGIFDYGIVPVENNTGGQVNQVNQLVLGTQLYVIGAVELPIHHCLLAPQGADYRELHSVYSHTQALEQCRQFLTRNKLQPVPYYDTAGAARMIAEHTPPSAAAIASKLAAELYNLEIIKENIEDFPHNITRFLIFARQPRREPGEKCSIVFSTEHKAGTLFRVLEVFARRGINLTRIESMPNLRGSFAFFLDFEGDQNDERVKEALQEVRKLTTDFRMLGCYNEKRSG